MTATVSLLAVLALFAAIPALGVPVASLRVGPQGDRAVLLGDGRAANDETPGPFFAILYSDEGDIWKAQTWRELQPDSTVVRERGTTTIVEVPSFGGQPVELKAEARPRGGEIRWSVAVRNRSHGTVVGVVGPALRGVKDLPGGVLAFPDRPGQRLADPWRALAGAPFRLRYPVPASMQYLVYTGEGGGAAYHVLDRGMVYKELTFGGPGREMSVTQYAFVPPGGGWSSPTIVWQALAGDWHAAADRYRTWFRSWAQRPQVSPQVRAMPVVGGIVILSRPVDDPNLPDVLKRQEVGTYAAGLKQALEFGRAGFQGMHLVGWFGRGHDTTYPDFDPSPAMGGEAGLRGLVRGMHAAGMIVTVYLNARLANLNSPTFLAHRDWEAKLPNGEVWREKYGDQTFTALCPAASGFQEHLKEVVLRVARDYGVDGAQMDQVGAASTVLCFNPTHGHRTPATAWADGYARLLRDIRQAVRAANPPFWMWIEGAWEGAGQYVDLAQGGFWRSIPAATYFPRMYRYTLPEHPLFGDALIGGVPYWCPSDIHRAMKIDAAAAPVFWNGRFMDDIGLTADPAAETHWFRDGNRAVLTVKNDATSARMLTLRLACTAAGRTTAPRSARALAADAPVTVRIEDGALVVPMEVPPGQVEAVLLRW